MVSLPFDSISNRGETVPVGLSGSGFYPHSSVDIIWYRPDGSAYGRYAAQVDEQGNFEYALLWLPERGRGIDGGWKAKVTDRTSGYDDVVQLNVHSDDQTPPTDTWPELDGFRPAPFLDAEVHASSSGKLCSSEGVQANVVLSGSSPNALVRVEYMRPDSRIALEQGVRVDGQGRVELLQSLNCRG